MFSRPSFFSRSSCKRHLRSLSASKPSTSTSSPATFTTFSAASGFPSLRPFVRPIQRLSPAQAISKQNVEPCRATFATMSGSDNTSGITPDSLKVTLTQKLDAGFVEIVDMSGGCGQAFEAIIVSPQFEKKTLLARHRLVNAAIKDEIAAIHAWTPKCYTPDQWENVKGELGY